MSSSDLDREALLGAIGREVGRELSARVVLFHQSIAERLGLNATDHKALDLLSRAGPITAGQLAELTGLTTGAVTGIIDRLEAGGFVRRERDPQDRRRVIIQPILHDTPLILPVFESLGQAMAEVCARYSDQELAAILDFTVQTGAVLQAETAKLQQERKPNHKKE